ncbi:MAG TPA: Ig-like domain-containing protein, partial [Arenicellales bacterium]|nr:Ig-like domain-containing protein [Arenicellales bacterium]
MTLFAPGSSGSLGANKDIVVDTTVPTVSSVSTTADNQSAVSITDNITVTFSEAMDTTYVTTSTADTNCAGTIRVSSDNFSSCVKMSSEPVSSNSNRTFTLDPYDNLTVSTTYKTRVTTGVKDTAGNTLGSQYETSTGFTTVPPPEWAQEAYIKAANNDAQDYFGHSVSLDNDTLAVGVQAEDSNQTTITNGTSASSDDSRSASGAVYVYKRTGTSWAQEAYIKAANLYYGDNFGFSVALDSDTLAVGAINEDSNQTTITNGTSSSSDNSLSDSGAVYVYKRTGTSWAPDAYTHPATPANGQRFGPVGAAAKKTPA